VGSFLLIVGELDPELGAQRGRGAEKLHSVLNVALGGTLRLDIAGHNLPAQKSHDIQPLRNDRSAAHRFEKVNSSHHQAIDRLAQGCTVESWCATDDVIEQFRLDDGPFGIAVQYHPERGTLYGPLFADFLGRLS